MASHSQADGLPSAASSLSLGHATWAPTTALAFCPTPACSGHQDVATLPQPSLESGHPGLGQPGNLALASANYLGKPHPPPLVTTKERSSLTRHEPGLARTGPDWGLGAGETLGEHKTVTSKFLSFTSEALLTWPSNPVLDLAPSGRPQGQGQAQLPNPGTSGCEEATET